MELHFVVAGGAGFIGSHMVDYLLEKYPGASVCCLDKVSYASNHLLQNLQPALTHKRFTFHRVNLATDPGLNAIVAREFKKAPHMVVINFAAESCVDRSFTDPIFFTQNNLLATQRLFEACQEALKGRDQQDPLRASSPGYSFIHISTDEVYGEQVTGAVDEGGALLPSNPYAASKAAADLLLHSYRRAYGAPISILRANNVYGPRQHPEKIVPCVLRTLREIQRHRVEGSGKGQMGQINGKKGNNRNGKDGDESDNDENGKEDRGDQEDRVNDQDRNNHIDHVHSHDAGFQVDEAGKKTRGCRRSRPIPLIPIHGTGTQKRRYLHVLDFVRAIDLVHEAMREGEYEEVYNVGSQDEITTLDLVARMLDIYGVVAKKGQSSPGVVALGEHVLWRHVHYVEDRPCNDSRYAIIYERIEDLGWHQRVSLDEGLDALIRDLTE